MFKVNNRKIWTRCEIYLNLAIKTTERGECRLERGPSFRTKMDTTNVKRNHEENIKQTTQKRQQWQTEKNLENSGTGKVDNFVCSPPKNLQVFDQILDIATWNYWGSQKGNSKRRTRQHWRCCKYIFKRIDLLKDIEEFAKKLGIEYIKQRSILTKITRFISIITSSGYLIGKKIEKILHLVVETILKEWPEQE